MSKAILFTEIRATDPALLKPHRGSGYGDLEMGVEVKLDAFYL